MMRFHWALLTALSRLWLAQAAPQVELGGTRLSGLGITSLGLEFFGGIPFAEPPLGDLRLAPPVYQGTPEGPTFNASSFGASCVQIPPVPNQSEDCLTINVLRPANIAPGQLLPVMVWVLGGGFVLGDTSQFNGSNIVAHSVSRGTPVIFVSANYRLGPLGFPQGVETQTRHTENLGIKDLLAALQWVQYNIGAFGGDKKKVTTFGNSSGAIMLSILFLNPGIGEFMRSAIFESGQAATAYTFPASRRQSEWLTFVSLVPECSGVTSTDTYACLRQANTSTLSNAATISTSLAPELTPWSPTLDGPTGVYPDLPSRLYSRGQFAKLPFIAGSQLDEGTIFAVDIATTQQTHNYIVRNITPSAYPITELNAMANKISQLYPDIPALGSPFGTGNETFGISPEFKHGAAIIGDVLFHSLRRAFQQLTSKAGITSFGYLFTDPQPALPPQGGVPHGFEYQYLFGTILEPTPTAVKLSDDMLDYWISFATSLDPNDAHGNTNRTPWPSYSANHSLLIQLNGANTTAIPDTYRQTQIAYLNSVPQQLRH